MDFKGQKLGGLWRRCGNLWDDHPGPKEEVSKLFYFLKSNYVRGFEARGLAESGLNNSRIPFESGVDFSLNCSVCLVKVTVFNLCHLVSLEHPIPLQRGVNYQLCLCGDQWQSFKKLANGCRVASIRHLCVAILFVSRTGNVCRVLFYLYTLHICAYIYISILVSVFALAIRLGVAIAFLLAMKRGGCLRCGSVLRGRGVGYRNWCKQHIASSVVTESPGPLWLMSQGALDVPCVDWRIAMH